MNTQKRVEEIKNELITFIMEKANGIADYSWGQEQFEKDILKKLDTLISQCEEEERGFLERLKLETDTVVCDCGEPYKDSDLSDLINERLQTLQKD